MKDLLGDCRLRVICWDKKERLGIIRGKFRKRCWINKSDIVLVALRDFEDDKCDIIQKYDSDQVKMLIKKNHFTSNFAKNGNIQTHDDESYSDNEDNFDDFYETNNKESSKEPKQEITTDDLDFDWDDI